MKDSFSKTKPKSLTGKDGSSDGTPSLDKQRPPFVHKFETKRQKYVYDVNTCRIIRVSPTVWDIIDDYGVLSREQMLGKYAPSYQTEDTEAALKCIAGAREREGLLLSHRPKQVRLPVDEDHVRSVLESDRNQLILNVTEDCNFRCSYCIYTGAYSYQPAHSARYMTWDVAKAAIDEFLDHSGDSDQRVISFYGGEPLLGLSLIERCVKYAGAASKGKAVRFALTTNGSLLTGRASDLLGSARFTILVSLDGPASVHDRHRRTKDGSPTWELVMANLRSFLETYPDYRTKGGLRFNAVVAPSTDIRNVAEFFGSCDLFSDQMGMGVSPLGPQDPMCVKSPLPIGERWPGAEELREKFIRSLKDGVFNKSREERRFWVHLGLFGDPFVMFHKRKYITPHLPETFASLSTCIPGQRRVFVSVEGDYFPCERTPQTEGMTIGNINEGVNPARAYELLHRWSSASAKDCRSCWCLPTCQVGCFATVHEDGRFTQSAKRTACENYRNRMHRLLMTYCDVLEANPKAFEYAAQISFV